MIINLGLKKSRRIEKPDERFRKSNTGYKQYLELQIRAISSLSHLNANGVTNTDIINMNQRVLIFRNNDFLSDPLDQILVKVVKTISVIPKLMKLYIGNN